MKQIRIQWSKVEFTVPAQNTFLAITLELTTNWLQPVWLAEAYNREAVTLILQIVKPFEANMGLVILGHIY